VNDVSDLRICSYAWTSEQEKIGSNHVCGLERGHVGEHDCLSCHATLSSNARVTATSNDGQHYVEKELKA
jgi:hypothetical protein